ncbi:amidase [Prosthecomicrobium pneumaticum]|uniref:Aspartyl-tRNA(Asn)/glutamyl-tRNA(Gln) amidotransferase subunit A n=1 Tax=Prosthecomicrobium pneumaticum TaxID=81895 RepID=A0A7W9CUK9_9HYPH|nr:aspartyl-tRNA(Asn)/glutamyl-tRNA(Gln) amidotransferase subunit A [Prosthecomicrobium pneumaticum]
MMEIAEIEGGARSAPNDLARLSAGALIEGYRSGLFTPSEVVEDVIAALERTDALCNVVVTPIYDQARAEAARATAAWSSGTPEGPLCGVPVTVKDLIYVSGVPAHAGAPVLEHFVPETDAAVVGALKAAGAIITAKTTTCEAGYKLTADSPLSGITRNPWSLDRTSGGSSGGAAAAVAAGCGPLAVGTDGVGSIRVPSSFCGVFGMKPTFGLVPRAPGFSPPSWASLAHTGPIARTVADAALLLETIAGYDLRDGASLPVGTRRFDTTPGPLDGLTIAASADLGHAPVAPAVRAAFEAALATLAGLGATIVPDHPGIDPEALDRILKPIAFTEQAAAVLGRSEDELGRSDADYRRVLEHGRSYRGIDYVAATHRRTALRAQFLDLFRRADLFVTPATAVTAFSAGTIGVDEIDGRPVDPHLGWSPFSWPINLAGLPAASVPCGFDAAGLPIGLQIVAPWLEEGRIFRVAAAFEAERPWAVHWPAPR